MSGSLVVKTLFRTRVWERSVGGQHLPLALGTGSDDTIGQKPSSSLSQGGKWKGGTPFQNNRHSSDRVPLEALDDFGGLVAIDAVDGTALDHL